MEEPEEFMNVSKAITSATAPAIALTGLFERASGDLLFAFNYHEVSNTPSRFCRDFNLNVRPEVFAKQLVWIRKNFHVISPRQLLSGDFELPAALVTFDDGFRGAFNEGADLLKQAGIPAVVFMNMAPVQGHPFWSGLVNYLCNHNEQFKKFIARKYGKPAMADFFLYCTKDDVSEFIDGQGNAGVLREATAYYGELASEQDLSNSASRGLYLGNHLFDHHNAVALSASDLTEQYLLNESALSAYGNHVPLFSYPFGQPVSCYNQKTDALITSLGAARIFTAFPLFNRNKHAHRLHRTSMSGYVDSEKRFRANCLVPPWLNYLWRAKICECA
jgi:peptidoglycan/xylan/chitin deacetylase (PgdA/CDA1 family)